MGASLVAGCVVGLGVGYEGDLYFNPAPPISEASLKGVLGALDHGTGHIEGKSRAEVASELKKE